MSTHDENKPDWADAPVWANYLTQDQDGEWTWHETKPHRYVDGWEKSRPARSVGYTSPNPSWHNTLEERPAPPLPSDEPDSDGWITWHGGECPVAADCFVRIKMKRAGEMFGDAREFYWRRDGSSGEIIAYRVIEPASDALNCSKCGDSGFIGNSLDGHKPCKYCDALKKQGLIDEPTADGVLTGSEKHRAIANAMDAGEGPEAFEFTDATGNWETADCWPIVCVSTVRRKPTTRHLIDQNGVRHEFPEPMREAPEPCTRFWFPVFDSVEPAALGSEWPESVEPRRFRNGFCHLTKEAAQQHARALIAASGGAA